MSDQPNDIEAVFVTALSKGTPDERAAYLDEACRNAPEARKRVEALLEAHDDAGSFLEKPAAEFVPTAAAPDATGNTGDSLADEKGVLELLLPTEKADCLGTIGQYEITEVVGRGGMGVVLKGNDPKLNRVVAVKVLAPELASNASARKRFLREGRAAAAVSHDHVVTIYGIDDSGTLPFIAMEYISGPSLEDRIKSEGTLELTEILRIGMQIASGLAAAHEQGLAHRDVKPANILLENGVEKVKITDFGLARAVDDVRMTKPGVVTGTPEYMSPEQARGESVDHRTDLFSLGSVLYAMCVGRSPFRAENTPAMIRRVCEDTPRPIQDVNTDIPDWLIHIIDELLAKSPADRVQSASELAELLGQCLAHLQQPSVNPLPERLESARVAWRRTRRGRRGWLAAAVALLVALGGLSLTEATGVTDVAGTVIRIVRGDGTLVIHVDDPEVSVSIDGEQLVITGAGAKEIRLAVGQHELRAVKDGKPVHTESVTITRDGRQVVKVYVKPMPPAEAVEAPETEETAEVVLQEVWGFAGLDDLDVLAISRDGRYCAFTNSDTGDLTVRNLTTGEDRRPAEMVGNDIDTAAISPNNRWIAHTTYNERRECYEVGVVGIDGSHNRVLYRNEEKDRIVICEWSPDSQHVLATSYDADGRDVGKLYDSVRIVTIAVADGSPRVLKALTPEENGFPMPHFSPDGRYVAYSRVVDTASNKEDIFLIPLNGEPEVPLVESPADHNVLGWLPDGQHLLFSSHRSGQGHDLWMMKVVAGKPQGAPRLAMKSLPMNVNRELFFLRGPVLTPNGGWAFYYRERGESLHVGGVYLGALDPDSAKLVNAPKLMSQPSAGRERVLSPDFSPDGKYLAYYVAPEPERSPQEIRFGPGSIVIRSLETGDDREVTLSPKFSDGGWPPKLRWHPDGSSILIEGRSEEGGSGLFRVDVATGKLTPLVAVPSESPSSNWQLLADSFLKEGNYVKSGEWSPDGKAVLYARYRSKQVDEALTAVMMWERASHWRVLRRNLETGMEKELFRNPEGEVGLCNFSLSPDGQHALVGGSKRLEIIPIAGGEPRELLKFEGEFPRRIRWMMTWAPDGRYVLFLKYGKGTLELWRIAADGGVPERVHEFPAGLGTNTSLRIHPDGRQIALVASRRVQKGRLRMLQMVVSDELANEARTRNFSRTKEASDDQGHDRDYVPPGKVVEVPETEPEAVIELQETWPYEGLGELDVLSISRDGRYCAFSDLTTGGLMVRDLRTGKDQRLTEKRTTKRGIPSEDAHISPDNKWVVYVEGDWREKKYDVRVVGIIDVMAIVVVCPNGHSLKVKRSSAGRTGRCPVCKALVKVPSPPSEKLSEDATQQRILYPNEEKSGIRLAGWSPDGQHVLAALFETVGDNSGPTSVPVRIATISVADGSTRVLKSLTAEETDIPRPLFSPGGRYVVYSRVVDTASKQRDIFLIPLDGGPEFPLVESPADDDVFGWLPDGKNLPRSTPAGRTQNFLFRSDRLGLWGDEIWMIQVVDGKPQGTPRLVSKDLPSAGAKFCLGPVRTPTRGWAFYYRESGERKAVGGVYLADLDPETGKLLTAPKQITQRVAGRERILSPDFSRDGKYLAYYVAPSREGKPHRCPPGNVVIRSLESGHEREIILSPKLSAWGPKVRLRWAPDGRSILAQGRIETGYQGIFRMDIETGRLDPVVTRTTLNWQQPSGPGVPWEFVSCGEWSSDGKTVFYIRGRNDPTKEPPLVAEALVAHDLETGREREVYRHPEGEFEVVGVVHAVSPDGQRVVFKGRESLKILPTAGGKARELVRFEEARPHRESLESLTVWMPDSRFLLYVTVGQGVRELWRIAAEGGAPERVDEFPLALGTVWGLRVHPDGRQVAFLSNQSIPQRRIRMLQIFGLDELAKETCTANLRTIGSAIEQYKKDHGDVPDGFADLFPDYLQDNSVLLCPGDRGGGEPLEGAEDPNVRCSYGYPFRPETEGLSGLSVVLPAEFPHREGMTWKDAKKLQMEYYGPVVPVAMCFQSHDAPMWLGYDGEIHEGEDFYWTWEKSPKAKTGLLSQLKSAMQSGPATWPQRYDMQRFHCLLDDEGALTKFLKTHIEEHPEDEAARKFLADVPRLRFSWFAEGDAEEDVDDGSVSLRNDDLDLIHDADPGDDEDQVVGIHFQDIPVPQGARVKRVYVQFTAYPEDPGSEKTDLVLHAELAADAEPFAEVKHNITSRRKTAASVKWSPEPWTVGGERSEKQRTPDLSALIQEVVDQPDWQKGNSLVLVISGSGRRNAESWHSGSWSGLPMLYVEH